MAKKAINQAIAANSAVPQATEGSLPSDSLAARLAKIQATPKLGDRFVLIRAYLLELAKATHAAGKTPESLNWGELSQQLGAGLAEVGTTQNGGVLREGDLIRHKWTGWKGSVMNSLKKGETPKIKGQLKLIAFVSKMTQPVGSGKGRKDPVAYDDCPDFA